MDFNELMKPIFNAPVYVWVILFFVIAYFFRDKSRWKKEVNFSQADGIGRGEVEIEYSKSKGAKIEVEMKLVEKYQNKPVAIFINEQLVCTVPAHENNGSGKDYEEPYGLDKPNQGDLVKVVIEGEIIFDGQFN